MILKANYHTHTVLCHHAVGMTKDYVEVAIKANMAELGMSDHAPVLKEFMTTAEHDSNWTYDSMTLEEFYKVYLPDVKQAREKYESKIKIYIALETEFIPKQLEYYQTLYKEVDYLVLGMHYFVSGNRIVNSYSEINYSNVMEYANNCKLGMESGLYKILAHPDLFMFDYKDESGKRVFDKYALAASRVIIESAIKNNCFLEINANGLKNSITYGNGTDWLYPVKEFWEVVKEYKDAKIIIGADAHSPDRLISEDITKVYQMALDLNLKVEDFI